MNNKSNSVLIRRYLRKRLWEYYSQPADAVVGSTGSRVIDFASILNEWHWKYVFRQRHNEINGMWLTPVELFTPYYSNIMANFVSKSMSSAMNTLDDCNTFDIVELGGGRGTNANALLSHLSKRHREVYDRLRSYTIYDTSPTLHELQRKVLIDESVHAEKVKLVNIDMMDVAEGSSDFLSQSEIPTTLIALELLDNLPHDKIGQCIETGDILQGELMPIDPPAEMVSATLPHLATAIRYTEAYFPVNDPLLRRILSMSPSLYTPLASLGPRWVPTVALGILMRLFECRPNSSVVFADFDWLPPPDNGSLAQQEHADSPLGDPATGDPLVTDMNGTDHTSYLTSPPNLLCDILFPTDFTRMAKFAKLAHEAAARSGKKGNRLSSVTVSAMKQRDFLIEYGGPDEVDKTKGLFGYSPLIDDFGNCSVLTATPR